MVKRNRYALLTPNAKTPKYFKTEKQREQARKKAKSGMSAQWIEREPVKKRRR